MKKYSFKNDFDKNCKPQKFFYRDLDLDLNEITENLKIEYDRIKNLEMFGIKEHNNQKDLFTYTQSVSTHKSREYNGFQMYYPFMHELFSSVVDMVREACVYYDIDYNSQQFMCQSWFNINNVNSGNKKLDWHDHVTDEEKIFGFHGYYCVNAEPSETHYKINENIVTNKNKNNRAILSLLGFPHTMADWEWPGDRITIAYDVFPLDFLDQRRFLRAEKFGTLKKDDRFWEQHWFPIPKLYSGDTK